MSSRVQPPLAAPAVTVAASSSQSKVVSAPKTPSAPRPPPPTTAPTVTAAAASSQPGASKTPSGMEMSSY
jgi:hypothetical protein